MTFLFEAGQQYCTLYLRVYALLERDLLNIYWSEYVSALWYVVQKNTLLKSSTPFM
jgi:hypothetical protein